MREYRFSIGNTNTGEIGMSFSIKADTQPEAIQKANEAMQAMQQMSDIHIRDNWLCSTMFGAVVYFNTSPVITEEHLEYVYDELVGEDR